MVVIYADRMLQKSGRRSLLELKTAVDRGAGIDQQSQFQWEICLLGKFDDLLRRFVIVENVKILRLQIAHELAMFIHGDEQNVNLIDPLLDSDDRCRIGAFDISTNRWGCYGYARSDIGLRLTVGWLSCEPQANQQTKNRTYVLHSQTIQKLHQ